VQLVFTTMGGNPAGNPQQQQRVLDTLEDLGVHVLEPDTPRDQSFAEVLGVFAAYCLEEDFEATLRILEQYNGESVGELQGGSDSSSIYRVSIFDSDDNDDEGGGAVADLFQAFKRVYPQYASKLTVARLQQYMLQMCNDPRRQDSATYSQLGNLMFILSVGKIPGQVRHIDHMDPNLQVCLYMSDQCPATVVYELEEPQTSPCITNCQELLDYWAQQPSTSLVPPLVRDLLTSSLTNTVLEDQPHLNYFRFWKTLNAHFQHFGKLYQHVAERLAIATCAPGTTLIARGNQVHAGPPSNVPRMFAFCIGIPDDDGDNDDDGNDDENTDQATSGADEKEDQNGEIQYNPALLHADLCCILFTSLDFGNDNRVYSTKYDDFSAVLLATKQFLLGMLPAMIREYPHETYARLVEDDRAALRSWLGELVEAVANDRHDHVTRLIDTAATSTTILMSPDVAEGTPWRRKWKKEQKRSSKRP